MIRFGHEHFWRLNKMCCTLFFSFYHIKNIFLKFIFYRKYDINIIQFLNIGYAFVFYMYAPNNFLFRKKLIKKNTTQNINI